MEIINHQAYVSLEVAKLLKEAGFNWECREYFDGIEFYPDGSVECTNYNSNTCKYLKVPTLDVAQRWLREVKNCNVGVEVFVHNLDKNNIYYTYNWFVYFWGSRYSDSDDTTHYYEEAQETSIKKALEIILEEGV